MRFLTLIFYFFIVCSAYGGYPETVKSPVDVIFGEWGKRGHLTLLPSSESSAEQSKDFTTNEFEYLQLKSRLVVCPVVRKALLQPTKKTLNGYHSVPHEQKKSSGSDTEMMTLYFKNGEQFKASEFGKWASWITVRAVYPKYQECVLATLHLSQTEDEYVAYTGEVRKQYLGIESNITNYLFSPGEALTLELLPFSAGTIQLKEADHPEKYVYDWYVPASTFDRCIKFKDFDCCESPLFYLADGDSLPAKLRLWSYAECLSVALVPEKNESFGFKKKDKLTVAGVKTSDSDVLNEVQFLSGKLNKLNAVKDEKELPILAELKFTVDSICERMRFSRGFPYFSEPPAEEYADMTEQPRWLNRDDCGAADYYQIKIRILCD